jgi:hypothetical protein
LDSFEAQLDFDTRRRQAFWHELRAVLSGRARTLLSFDEVMSVAKREGQVDRGMQDIPVAKIKGSEGRASDFDASFFPLNRRLRERWARIETLMMRGVEMPPIEVYRVGHIYFVKDGHHRVSVARTLGYETVRASVIEVRTRVPLTSDMDAKQLLRAAEYANFLEMTELDRLRPQARLECSELGHYDIIYEHILGHRYFMGLERGEEVPLSEAVADWFDEVYRPIVDVVRRHKIADHFPGLTEADLYISLTRRWLEMSSAGEPGGPEDAGASLLHEAFREQHRPALSRMVRRWGLHRSRRTLVLGSPLRRLREARSKRR